jgi:uncharacterized protein YjbI with pentapeptide repeats
MSDETPTPPEPKWGDPIRSIAPGRQEELRGFAEAHRAWLATGPTRDPEQNPYRRAWVEEIMTLSGAEVFFLAATAIAAKEGIALGEAEQRLRARPPQSLDAVHLEGAVLMGAHLEGANLSEVHLEGADLRDAHCEGAAFFCAHLERANLFGTYLAGAGFSQAHLAHANFTRDDLERVFFQEAHLEGANFCEAHLEGATFDDADLAGAAFIEAHLENASFKKARLAGANMREAHLRDANLSDAHLERTDLTAAHLEGANLIAAHLEGANLRTAHLEGANLSRAHLARTNLRGAFFSAATTLEHVAIADKAHGVVRVADVRWQDVNLAVISQWSEVAMLGDELRAHKVAGLPLPNPNKSSEPLPKGVSRADREKAREMRRDEVLFAWRNAARAYRQLASVMRDQGMSDEADRFAYRGQLCQRQVYRYAGQPVRRGFSWFLDLLSGYGYKPQRSLVAYLTAILGFAALFLVNSHFVAPHLSWDEAIVLSMSSFHGRGFFNPSITLGDTYARLAALEAFVGLVIEVSFIATFTQRFFGR